MNMKLVGVLIVGGLVASAAAAQGEHAARQTGGLLFHYGLVPAEVVLAHPPAHTEREMHGGPGRGESHIVLALFEAKDQTRIAIADVTVHITHRGSTRITRLQPMTIAGQASFGGFVSVKTPGVYSIRFDVRRPGVPGTASAEFEHRVSPELRR